MDRPAHGGCVRHGRRPPARTPLRAVDPVRGPAHAVPLPFRRAARPGESARPAHPDPPGEGPGAGHGAGPRPGGRTARRARGPLDRSARARGSWTPVPPCRPSSSTARPLCTAARAATEPTASGPRVAAGDQDVLDAAVLQLREPGRPGLGAFAAGACPHAQDVTLAFEVDPHGDVEGPVGDRAVADPQHGRVDRHHRVDAVRRPLPPGVEPLGDLVGRPGDQVARASPPPGRLPGPASPVT